MGPATPAIDCGRAADSQEACGRSCLARLGWKSSRSLPIRHRQHVQAGEVGDGGVRARLGRPRFGSRHLKRPKFALNLPNSRPGFLRKPKPGAELGFSNATDMWLQLDGSYCRAAVQAFLCVSALYRTNRFRRPNSAVYETRTHMETVSSLAVGGAFQTTR